MLKKGSETMPDAINAHGAPKTYPLRHLTVPTVAKIEARLQKELDSNATISFATGTLSIDPTKVEAAQRVIDAIEPGVVIELSNRPQETASAAGLGSGSIHSHQHSVSFWPLAIAGLLFVSGPIFKSELTNMAGGWAEYIVFVTAYLLVGNGVLRAAMRNALQGQFFDENFLMTIATLGAFAIGNLPEAVGVMLFYYVGELLQDIAVSRSRGSIQALLDIRPDTANLKTATGITEVSPNQVSIGDVILVRPGERIPLDGEVTDGESFVDTSALTGESVPQRVVPGKAVLAGMVNNSGLLQIRVTKTYSETSWRET